METLQEKQLNPFHLIAEVHTLRVEHSIMVKVLWKISPTGQRFTLLYTFVPLPMKKNLKEI